MSTLGQIAAQDAKTRDIPLLKNRAEAYALTSVNAANLPITRPRVRTFYAVPRTCDENKDNSRTIVASTSRQQTPKTQKTTARVRTIHKSVHANMACLSLLISTAIGLSCAVSLPPNLQLAQSLHPNITTTPSTTHLLTTWPPAPFTYAFHGLTIDISAYALHTPPQATNPILLNLIAIQNEI